MADRSREEEGAVAGALGAAEEGFGEEAGGKADGSRVAELGGVSGVVLADSRAGGATLNGVADVFPRDSGGDGDDGLLGNEREDLRLDEVDEKAGSDRKFEEEGSSEGVLTVGSCIVNDVVGGEVKFNKERGGVEMKARVEGSVGDRKVSYSDGAGVAASCTVEDHRLNADITSENMEGSLREEIIASNTIDAQKSNIEVASGNMEGGLSLTTSTATLGGGANSVDGKDVIWERNFFGNTSTDQLVHDNGQDYCVTHSAAEGTALAGVVPTLENMEVDEASAPSDYGLGDDDAMKIDKQFDGVKDLEMTLENGESEGDLKTESSRGVDEAVYQLPPDPEDMFAVCNLVWGKVRSHPWWPGQIFDPSDASEKAMKYHKKDSFLVAYFGDHTFAWNEASLLKPFRSYFSNAVKQGSSESFQNAVNCALEEVSRRVELGLACSCLSEDVLDEIKVQVVENAGIQLDSCTRASVDKSMHANTFKPVEFIRYLKGLALSASSGANRLELVIAKAQLLAIYRHKDFNQLPEFQSFGDLEEDNTEALDLKDSIQAEDAKDGMAASCQEGIDVPKGSAHRRKHNLKDVVYHRRKERSVFELMDEAMMYSEDDEFELDGTLLAKRRGGLKKSDESGSADERKSISSGKVASPLPKPSFKIGECISRVASQMTRPPSLKTQNEEAEHVEHDAEKVNTGIVVEDQSLEGLLSQLQSAAVSPLGRYSFSSSMTCLFSDFRNSVAVGLDLSVGRLGGKRKRSSQHAGGSSEAFEFEDMKDSHWTDRIIGNGLEDNADGVINGENQLYSSEQERPRRPGRRPYAKRRNKEVSDALPEKPVEYVDPNSPAELVLTFPEPRFIPSEVRLNKTFKRFGALNELQTELDRDGNRARVVFKKCRDAEVAYSSASKFNIFGSLAVNYQLNHVLSEPFASYYQPVPLPEAPADTNQDSSANASLAQVG
ncbi:hypothetical protein MLD38_038105 [Melastoma candidum]|uniref:Uncharacterized protein n=1 Tax=Melastoma candidum TaxID=119954 RepID=A0ACB9KYK3_9MYRT|nr:hypothetical protein MLD38_038105 [Melastoma candidum]